ncbi:MAG: FAD-dependent oxidoreductase [Acidimicrobiaceae bacterium]|nr:FAD-dependent oxidoreductase [Acidimicrobiaceae bacterium]
MAEHPRYPHIFSPIKLGPVEIPNRFFFSPHGVGLTVGTRPSFDFPYYSAERVKGGGCGLVVNSLTVHDRGTAFQATPYREESVPAFSAMAESVHDAGGKIFGEIWYHWMVTGWWQPLSPPAPSLTPSNVQYQYAGLYMSTHEMSKDEIRAMVDAHRQSAAHLRQAGYDGVMLHASHSALAEAFTSPYFNNRTDEYGGSLENRLRFLTECLEAAREGAGDAMAVGMRLNCDELISGGYDTSGAREILERICGAGLVDYVDLDVALEPQELHLGMPPVLVEPHVYKPYVEAVRSATQGVPVLSVLGRMTSVADAEEVVASGLCDMVGAARALIAEPHLVKNAYEGNEERSRTCIACNWCLEALSRGAAGCSINPASYRERLWGVDTFTPATSRSRVIVIGGGPGGLEAARVAALRGHDVTLVEGRDHLGGALALWASLPGREFFSKSVEWWQREVERLGVRVRLGTEATADMVLAERPDAVIVATGALYSRGGRSGYLSLDIPGHDRDFVYCPEDVLLRGVRPSGRVVLLDGEGLHASLGVAEVLASAGATVEYMMPEFSPVSHSLVFTGEWELVVQRLKKVGVSFTPATYIRSIDDHALSVYDVFSKEERTISPVDAVVLSTGRVPQNELAKALEGKVAQLFTIGDALGARPLATAAYEGQKFARYIGEPDTPRTVAEAYFQSNPPELMPQPAEVLLKQAVTS